jgi:hypothetical protein
MVNDKEWGGVFVSRSGGLSWSQLSAGLDGRDVFALGQAPDGTIVAGTGHGIYRLKDAVWQRAGDAGARPVAARKASAVKAGAVHPPGKRGGAAGGAGAAVKGFDGSVYGFAQSGETLFAATSQGLLRSASSGLTWSVAASIPVDEYRFLAAARGNMVAASLGAVELSNDGGDHWQGVALPPGLTQVSAAAVDGQGGVWIAGRDGVFYSTDKGAGWQTLPGLYVRNASCLYFDEDKDRLLVTSGGSGTQAFAVQLPGMQVTTWDTGWNLRFVRPVGSYLVAGTLFDGIVVQPMMVDSPDADAVKAAR